jgi:hypothetical protein
MKGFGFRVYGIRGKGLGFMVLDLRFKHKSSELRI